MDIVHSIHHHMTFKRDIIMKVSSSLLLIGLFLVDSTEGFAFQLPSRPNALLHGVKPDNEQQESTHLYIPDDEDILINGRKELNGMSESRTFRGAKIYLPDDFDYATNERQPQTSSENTGHVYAGIPDEELLIQESDEFEAFKWMNSNTQTQVADKTTAGKKSKTAAGSSKPMALKHLFRYFTDICVDCWLSTVDPVAFLLSCNYTKSDITRSEEHV